MKQIIHSSNTLPRIDGKRKLVSKHTLKSITNKFDPTELYNTTKQNLFNINVCSLFVVTISIQKPYFQYILLIMPRTMSRKENDLIKTRRE